MNESQIMNNTIVDSDDMIMVKLSYAMAKKLWLLVIPAAVLLGVFKGIDSSIAVLLAGVILLINLVIMAELSRFVMSISPQLMIINLMGGFIIHLSIVFISALIVRNVSLIDFRVWLLSVAIGHLTLYTWETIRIGFSLTRQSQIGGIKAAEQTVEN